MLKSLNPSRTDVEFRSLAPDSGGGLDLMEATLTFFQVSLRNGKDFELMQAYIGLFFNVSVFPFAIAQQRVI